MTLYELEQRARAAWARMADRMVWEATLKGIAPGEARQAVAMMSPFDDAVECAIEDGEDYGSMSDAQLMKGM